MTRIRSFLIVIVIIVLCDYSVSKPQFRSKRSGRDYILRSCTATAYLIRKHRNHAISDLPKNTSAPELIFSLPKQSSKYHSPIKSDARTHTREESAKLKLPNKRLYHGRRIGNHINRANLPEFNLKDTPLRTVHIEPIYKNRPPIFMKKDPLPELKGNVPGEDVHADARVVVVKPLH
ncbi:uncharacterized protein LOC117181918 [Belonocnema kinseyi]|uniref:uncharacterized protein LOC117181918 n=1 Tax=Belonocnema kinseyi TaxID=2817044 RepID=UPI00143DC891|nr:uncharacterized protein LOC117181918 [Belonocnema kinseyi]